MIFQKVMDSITSYGQKQFQKASRYVKLNDLPKVKESFAYTHASGGRGGTIVQHLTHHTFMWAFIPYQCQDNCD